MKYLFKYYPLAVILMIAILIALFKDYRKPAIIVLCLPLLFIGVIFGMMLSGKTSDSWPSSLRWDWSACSSRTASF